MGADRELVEQAFELYNNGDIERLVARYAADAWEITPDGPLAGRDAIAARLRRRRARFPDQQAKPVVWVEEADCVVVEYSWSATSSGPAVGAEGTFGARETGDIAVAVMSIFHVRNGAISAHRLYWDRLPCALQKGQIPLPQLRLGAG